MKIRKWFPGALAAAFILSTSPQAAAAVEEADFLLNSTQDLFDLCSIQPDDPDYIPATYACRGFMHGAVQYHDAVTDRKNLKRLICYPESATVLDGRVAFLAWGKANQSSTEYMAEPPVVGLVRALADKYPCSK